MLPRSSSHSDDHYDDGGYCDDEDDDDDDDDGELPEASCSAQSQFLGCCEQAGRRGKQMSEISKSFRSGMGADKKSPKFGLLPNSPPTPRGWSFLSQKYIKKY